MSDLKNKYYLYGWLSTSKVHDNNINLCIDNVSTNIITNIIKTISYEFDKLYTDINNYEIKIPAIAYNYIDSIPDIENEELKWYFIRGIFDNIGYIETEAIILTKSDIIKKFIIDTSNLDYYINNLYLIFRGVNCVDFLSKVYNNITDGLINKYKYNEYINNFIFKTIPICNYVKKKDNAVDPVKLNCSDEGYDLFIIDKYKKISNNTFIYDTGIVLIPEDGWHIEICARSSLIKYGYIVSNGIGIIDTSYRGSIKISLTKVFDTDIEIKFPFKAVQALLRPNIHYIMNNTKIITKTIRNDKGFGSTDDDNIISI